METSSFLTLSGLKEKNLSSEKDLIHFLTNLTKDLETIDSQQTVVNKKSSANFKKSSGLTSSASFTKSSNLTSSTGFTKASGLTSSTGFKKSSNLKQNTSLTSSTSFKKSSGLKQKNGLSAKKQEDLKQQTEDRILEWAGFLALENKLWPIAEKIFSFLLKRRNKVMDLVGLAKALRNQSRFNLAEKHYLKALEKINTPCPLLFIVYKALGEISLFKNDFLMAEEYYNKAGTLKPACASLIFHRAMMYLKEKDYKQAEKNFQKFIATHLNSAKAWLGLALCKKALGDEEMALACLKRTLDLDPKNSKALELKKQWMKSVYDLFSLPLNFSA